MNAPFTTAEFLDVFARYNNTTTVAPFLLGGLAVSAIFGIVRGWKYGDRWACGVLTLLWLWSGAIFHLGFFADVNPAAIGFGVLFLGQAGAFFWRGVMRHDIRFDYTADPMRTFVGAGALAYAIVVYPLVGLASGHHWPATPTFGAPCPVDIFTLGLLFWSASSTPRFLLVVPVAWSLLASVAAWQFGMHEDWGLGLIAVIAVRFATGHAGLRRVPRRHVAGQRSFWRRKKIHGSKT